MKNIKLKTAFILVLGLSITGCAKSPKLTNNLKLTEEKIIIKGHKWKVKIFTNKISPKGVFWFLPHDNENTAEESARYAVKKYGGGYLKICANNQREFKGIDPNRYFNNNKFANKIIEIINRYRTDKVPYLTLHNNTNGGGVSILRGNQDDIRYKAHKHITKGHGGLSDEDSLVYIAGKNIQQSDINALTKKGLNVISEKTTTSNNDGSMSNYIALKSNPNC